MRLHQLSPTVCGFPSKLAVCRHCLPNLPVGRGRVVAGAAASGNSAPPTPPAIMKSARAENRTAAIGGASNSPRPRRVGRSAAMSAAVAIKANQCAGEAGENNESDRGPRTVSATLPSLGLSLFSGHGLKPQRTCLYMLSINGGNCERLKSYCNVPHSLKSAKARVE